MNSTIISRDNPIETMFSIIRKQARSSEEHAARQMAIYYAYQLHGMNFVRNEEEAIQIANQAIEYTKAHGLFPSKEAEALCASDEIRGYGL